MSLLVVSYMYVTSSFGVITAERINIVNSDGTTVLAIANKQRVAAPRVEGKEYPVDMVERQHFAGMIFFNEAGDEIGGLLYNSATHSSGKTFGAGHLSFDRHNDNQVINLEHKENIHGTVKSGITFYDRAGDGSMRRSFDLTEEYLYGQPSAERKKEIIAESKSLRNAGKLGVERVFLGSENAIAHLTFKDTLGRDRMKLFIDSTQTPRFQFLDESGNVLNEFPKAN